MGFITPWLALALIMNLTRYTLTDIQSYVYLNWNVFLAFLPLLFLYFFDKAKNIYLKALLFLTWLFFLPNAPYLVTDLIHLRDVGPEWMLWFDGMMIFIYALIGIFITAFVLLEMKKRLFEKSINKQNIFLIIISLLTAFGVYLGRYIRFNSWDVLAQPIELANQIISTITIEYMNPVFVTTIIFFTLFILASTESCKKLFK